MIRIGDLTALGGVIRDLRLMHMLSQRALAEAAGFSKGQVSDWERGARIPEATSLARVLKGLGFELAIVPAEESGPETAPASTFAAETPSAGVLGCAGGDLEALRAPEGCGSERRPVTDPVQFCHGTGNTCPRHGAVCR